MELRLKVWLIGLALMLPPGSGSAETSDRPICEAAVEKLGFPTSDYSFEEGGFLSSDTHHFGELTCIVSGDKSIQFIGLRGVTLAENGVVGPHLLLLQEAIKQSSSSLVALASDQRREAVKRAEAEYEHQRREAHEREEVRVDEVNRLLELSLSSLYDGSLSLESLEKLGIDTNDPRFKERNQREILELADATAAQDAQNTTWTEAAQNYYQDAMKIAAMAYEDPRGAASSLKDQGVVLLEMAKQGSATTYVAVVEKTGEAYDLITGKGVCETIEVINNEAVSYIGGAASGFAGAASMANPSRYMLVVHRTYDELTIIRGVGFIQRSFTSGFIATKVVPALPSAATGVAAASAVVYLGATGACYVTSPEAKEHLESARSFTFSALDAAKEKAEAIIRYVMK